MKLTDSEKEYLSGLLGDSEEGWKNYLEVYDEKFDEALREVDDSIGSILANATISVLEQRRILQQAKTPSALVSALKLLAVTGGNLINAGTGVLKWMSTRFPHRDSIESNVEIGDVPVGERFRKFSNILKRFKHRDAECVSLNFDSAGRCIALVKDNAMGSYSVCYDFDLDTESCKTELKGIKTVESALAEIGKYLSR